MTGRCFQLAGLLLLSAVTVHAGIITLAWDPSSSTNAIGYFIYAGTNAPFCSTNYTVKVDAGTNLTCTVSNIVPGLWTFAATARDTNGLESDFSNTVTAEIPLPAPGNFRTVVLQYSGTILSTNWQDMGFFRIKSGTP